MNYLWHLNPSLTLRGFVDAHSDIICLLRTVDVCQDLKVTQLRLSDAMTFELQLSNIIVFCIFEFKYLLLSCMYFQSIHANLTLQAVKITSEEMMVQSKCSLAVKSFWQEYQGILM